MIRPILTAAATVLACASATHAQGRADLLLRDEPARPNRRCTVLDRLAPAQAAALDPAALRQAVSAEAGLPREGTALYSVRLDERGGVAWVRPLESTLSPAAELAVQEMVRGGVRAQPAEEPWAFRVRVTLGDAPEVRIGRSQLCWAGLTYLPKVDDAQLASLNPDEREQVRTLRAARIGVLVGVDGRVLDARVDQSSISRAQDRVALSNARRSEWLPQLVDGFPAEAWVGLYVHTTNR